MINGLASIESIKDIADSGITLPLRCYIKGIGDTYVKYIGNPVGTQVLINEWIGACIADIIELPIPEYGICYISENDIYNSKIEEMDVTNTGKAFYTRALTKAVPVNRGLLRSVINRNVETILVYDHLVNNCDRHRGNVLCDLSCGPKVVLIDNSTLFSDNYRYDSHILLEELKIDKIISGNIVSKNHEIYDMLIDSFGLNKELLISKADDAKKLLSNDLLDSIIKSIPQEWVEHEGRENVGLLLEQVCLRRDNMRAICEQIVLERNR